MARYVGALVSNRRRAYFSFALQLVLIDAGCEYAHYASDITRTFPVSGKFTEPQKDLYQAVLNVQKECVKRCTVKEEISMAELHRLSKSYPGIYRDRRRTLLI
jgi:Xaa-Pro aminopeptidase